MCGFGEPLIRTPKKFNVAVNVPDKGIKTFTLPSGYENHELLNEELDEIVE